MYDIEWINTQAQTADYSVSAVAEYQAGLGDGIERYTEAFERDYALATAQADDIGGLIVYTRNDAVVAVYDYERFCGWVQ